jgi:hypothetical protein
MTARILQFPPRGPFAVRVQHDGCGAWVVVCRSNGWLFGSRREALIDAAEIAAGFGVAVEVVIRRRRCRGQDLAGRQGLDPAARGRWQG